MSVEVLPSGVKCNLNCSYCYQAPLRDAGNFTSEETSIDRMIEALEKSGQSFTVFGGEALLTPFADLEKLFQYGFDKHEHNGVQTNGSLITDEHIALFNRYNVHVGFSMDGPNDLNDLRWAGSIEKTRIMTERSHKALYKLLRANHPCSLIVTLHRKNAVGDRLVTLKNWFNMLAGMGLKHARLHLLEVDHPFVQSLALTEDEAFNAIVLLEQVSDKLNIDTYSEIPRLMKGEVFSPTCIWNNCNPFNTKAVYGINSDGSLSNCGRTNKEGVNFLKSESDGNERYHALLNTPQEYGGCKNCEYFPICGGECPGQSHDWRVKTSHCSLLKRIFGYYKDKVGYSPILRSNPTDEHGDIEHQDHYDYASIVVEVIQ